MASMPSLTASGQGRLRVNLSWQLLRSAAASSRTVGEIESQHAGQPFGSFFGDILGHAVQSVVSAVAALEAFINEVFEGREALRFG